MPSGAAKTVNSKVTNSITLLKILFSRLKALDTAYGGEVADVSKADYDQRTPLHIAASEGNVEIVEYLLKSGASVHVRDRNDTTPLQDAIREGHLDVIDILIRYQYFKDKSV